MGKLAAAGASAGVLGTGGVATLVAHSLGAFGEGSESPLYLASTVEGFQQQNRGFCLHEFLDKLPQDQQFGYNNSGIGSVSAGDLKLNAASQSDKGCLVVNWDKNTNGQTKQFEGNFRFLWALLRDQAGFAVYMQATFDASSSDSPKVTFDGIAYAFSKDGNAWKTKKLAMKTGDTKTLTGDNIKKYFPKRRELSGQTTAFKDLNSWWNFLDDKNDSPAKVLGGKDTARYYWTWDKNAGSAASPPQAPDSMDLWSPNLKDWWNHFFDQTKWDMAELVKGVTGGWKKAY